MADKQEVKQPPTLEDRCLDRLSKRFAPLYKTIRKKETPLLNKLLNLVAKEIAQSLTALNDDAVKKLQDMLFQQRIKYSELICPLCDQQVPRTEYNGRTIHYVTTREAASNPHPDEDSIVRVRCAASPFWSLT
mgnify:CR=1 FL=1